MTEPDLQTGDLKSVYKQAILKMFATKMAGQFVNPNLQSNSTKFEGFE